MDTTRANHFGCYGNPWIQTPNIGALADESILFANYMTIVTTTLNYFGLPLPDVVEREPYNLLKPTDISPNRV